MKGSLTPNNHDGLAPAEPEPETGVSGLRGLHALCWPPLRLGLREVRVCAKLGGLGFRTWGVGVIEVKRMFKAYSGVYCKAKGW